MLYDPSRQRPLQLSQVDVGVYYSELPHSISCASEYLCIQLELKSWGKNPAFLDLLIQK